MERTPTSPRLAFERIGTRGPAVLLIMGLGMRGRLWRPQLERLGADHRLVAFDNRGIGESDPLTGTPGLAEFAADALRVADAAGFDRFHVVGVSLGGMIAQQLALSAPARARSLTLIATHAGGPLGLVPHPRGLYHFARALTGDAAQRAAALERLLYTESIARVVGRATLTERIAQQAGDRAPRRTLLAQLLAVARHDTRRALRTLAVPTLVIKPENDILVRPSHSDGLARLIPGARLLALPDAGHGAIFQHAEAVSDAIRAHIAAVEQGASP